MISGDVVVSEIVQHLPARNPVQPEYEPVFSLVMLSRRETHITEKSPTRKRQPSVLLNSFSRPSISEIAAMTEIHLESGNVRTGFGILGNASSYILVR